MKKTILYLLAACVLLTGCASAVAESDSRDVSVLESNAPTKESNVPVEGSGTVSEEAVSEEPISQKTALTEEELALLDDYLTAFESNLDVKEYRTEPQFLGEVDGYTLAYCGYTLGDKVEDGVWYSLFPYYPLQYSGVFLLDDGKIFTMEEAPEQGVSQESFASLLPQEVQNALNRRPAKEALSAEEWKMLDEFIDGTVEGALSPGEKDYIKRWPEIWLGSVGGYDLVWCPFVDTAKGWESAEYGIPEGWDYDCYVYPEGGSRAGVYLVKGNKLLKLEEVVGTEVQLEEVYPLLPLRVLFYLEIALDFSFIEEPITAVK